MKLIAAAGAGYLAASLFDPVSGRRRRAYVQGKLTKLKRISIGAFGAVVRDMRHRSRGVALEMGKVIRDRGRPVDDQVLVQRVRARIGRIVSHPRAIHVTARQGRVILDGRLLEKELRPLLRGLERVRGVKAVERHLQVFAEPGNVPELQGGVTRPDARSLWH